jgi:AICAR transformylase/IMP cyclohydrolase PurH
MRPFIGNSMRKTVLDAAKALEIVMYIRDVRHFSHL